MPKMVKLIGIIVVLVWSITMVIMQAKLYKRTREKRDLFALIGYAMMIVAGIILTLAYVLND